MKKSVYSPLLAGLLCLTLGIPALGLTAETKAGAVDTATREYAAFLAEHAGTPQADQDIPLDLQTLAAGTGSFAALEDHLLIEEDGELTFEITAPQTALYELELHYMPKPGRSAPCEVVIQIDGELPYLQASTILLDRIWKDATDRIETDSNGNDIRPAQVEWPIYSTRRAMDSTGYHTRPLLFPLRQGANKVTLHVNREGLQLRQVTFAAPRQVPTYAEYLAQYAAAPQATQSASRVQAELPAWKTSPVLTAYADRSSPLTEPYRGSKYCFNTIGGTSWNLVGETIAWNLEAPETGLYELRFKAKQDFIRGTYSSRSLQIDGQAPFAEAEDVRFLFDDDWQMVTVGNGDQPYSVYLTQGTHEISLEVTLGDLGEVLGQVNHCAQDVMGIYRQFLMIIGSTPDVMRDYKLERQLPETFLQMEDVANRLDATVESLRGVTGNTGTELLALSNMSRTLRDFIKKPYDIPAKFSIFQSDVDALTDWRNEASYRPLVLDYIDLAAPGTPLPRVAASALESIAYGADMFAASFVENYESLGEAAGGKSTITVWSPTGRDQAQVINELVKSYFTPQTGINVEIQLVQGDTILPSTVAGNGPDVILYANQQMPVNFALRSAATDLSQFEGFEETAAQFRSSALTPVSFQGGVYGLPETETFPMLFYRKDILDEIGVDIPTTWEDVLHLIPTLQRHHLDFLLDNGTARTMDSTLAFAGDDTQGLRTFGTLLFQRGGQLYEGDGIRTLVDQEIAIETFKDWCKLYTNYGCPINFNAAYRFRMGIGPLAVADLGLFNTLMVSAPEINGLWGMTTVPGTPGEEGLNRSVASKCTYTLMTSTCKEQEAAWEFIRWWLSEETQVQYARGLESLMGTSARYMTANTAAFARLPWSTKDLAPILEQSKWTVGIPEVAGGYFLSRHINNAFRSVAISKGDPREALITYGMTINEELREKRLEFGLPVAEIKAETK